MAELELLEADLVRLDLDLVRPHRSAGGRIEKRPVVLVRILTSLGEGVGECAAMAAPTYTEEYADGAEQVLACYLLPLLFDAGTLEGVEGAMACLDAIRGHQMAKAAVEMALLDAEGRASGRSMASRLAGDGSFASFVPAGATIGLKSSAEEVVDAVSRAVEDGYRRVKCKIEPGRDAELLEAVRAAHPHLVLVADANGSYRADSAEDLERLAALDDARIGLLALEQPLRAGDLVGHAALRRRLGVPIMLDESISDLGHLDSAIALQAADAVSIKPARLGGLLAGVKALRRARAAGVSCSIGGMLETGIGRAGAIALGSLPGFDLPGELGASDRYFAPDLCIGHQLVSGMLAVPSGPGLGVDLRLEALGPAAVRHRTHLSSSMSARS